MANIDETFIDDVLFSAESWFTETSDSVVRLSRVYDALYESDLMKKLSENGAIDIIRANARQLFLETVEEAVTQSEEYDYPELKDNLIFAIDTNLGNLITFMPDGNSVYVDVRTNMERYLGDASDWGTAVEKTRKILRVGTGDALGASIIWSTIYGVDREGRTVIKEKKDKEGNVIDTKDITAKFEGLYETTIGIRLGQLGVSSPAPYWELIDLGNVDIAMVGARGGFPYPANSPTHFVRRIEASLKEAYTNVYPRVFQILNDFQEASRRTWTVEIPGIDLPSPPVNLDEALLNADLDGATTTVRTLLTEVGSELRSILQTISDAPKDANKIALITRQGNELWELYRTQNNLLGARYSLINEL